jgi:hypothetical protein
VQRVGIDHLELLREVGLGRERQRFGDERRVAILEQPPDGFD